MFKRAYPMIWPVVFLAGGIVSVVWGGHLHFKIFGEMVMINLHTWMWFLMAAAHADAFWRRRRPHLPAGDADEEEGGHHG